MLRLKSTKIISVITIQEVYQEWVTYQLLAIEVEWKIREKRDDVREFIVSEDDMTCKGNQEKNELDCARD